jgi:NhaP-type Na+/H+ or K+/H+ antiporter
VLVFKKLKIRDTIKVLILLAGSFALVGIDNLLPDSLPFSGLLAVMALGATVLKRYEKLAKRISGKFSKIWVAAELVLFVLLGSAVDIIYAAKAGFGVVLLILVVLLFRFAGVIISLAATGLNRKEKLFCMIAYIPKATVQAAIGSLPLAAGLPAGPVILTAAAIAILITAPLGAIGIDLTYRGLLDKPANSEYNGTI